MNDFIKTPKMEKILIYFNLIIQNLKESKKEMFLSMFAIAAGEIMIFFGMVYSGLAIHIINLQVITLAIIFKNDSTEIKMIFQSLILLLLLRIVNLAMPQFFTMTLLWYPLTYGVMYIAVYSVISNQQITYKELGMNLERLHVYLPAALLIGIAAALIEYSILKPLPFIENTGLSNLILISVVMFIFVAMIEELIFRSILLTRLEKVLDPGIALILSGILFGMMHSGYGNMEEMLFAGIFGTFIGYIFQKTRSFPFIMLIHGTANVFLFGILPIISS